MGFSDIVHGVLDVAGFIPVVGVAADLANAAVYAAEGDWGNAALSAISAVPVVGDAAAVAGKSVKVAAKAAKASEGALSKMKQMKSVFGGMRGKAKTGAKKVSGKKSRKKKVEEEKKKAKKECTNGKCFTGDTLVWTKNGLRPIKEVRKGDDIYSRNEATGETGLRKVEEVFQTGAHTIYHICLDGKAEIKTTAYHAFYVREKGWIKSINLRENDLLEAMEGTARITRITKVRQEEPVAVYNFHVEEWSSYFVSESRIYVHNDENHDEGVVSLDPNTVRVSQSSVNGSGEITRSMKENGWKGDPIDVVEMPDGICTAVDNTRVVSAREAGIDVQARVHGYNDPLPSEYVERFTTKKGVPETWGDAVGLRVGKQNSAFRTGNPYGQLQTQKIK